MVSKEPSHLLTGQTNSKSTLADKLPGTMTVRSVLLNRDSPDIESRLKKRRNRTHQVRFKDLEDGSSSSGNSGTGENNINQRTSTDRSSPHPIRKHGSRTPLPWADEPHISSLPGQTSVVGAVRGDMASTIEVVAAFLARAPPHPLTPGPTRRCWTPPQANSLTLPMIRKPSTSTAIQTSPCLKKPLSTHTRSHSLGDSVGIDGDDEHDSQDENFFHNHISAHRPKDLNGASGCSERTTIERRSKSRTEMKSAVTVVKNPRHSGPPSVSNIEPRHCSSVSSQVGPKRQGSSTPSLVRRRKRFSRTTSDPGKEVHYCTTPTQTESHSLSPPRSNTKLCKTQILTEIPSSCPDTSKYFTTQSQTEGHTQSSPVNHQTLPPDGIQTQKRSSSCHTPHASSIEPCTTQPQSQSPCASQELPTSVDTMQIRSESLDSSLVKDRESLPNQTVPYNFTQLPPCLQTHIDHNSANKASFSVEKPTCSNSTKLLSSPYSTVATVATAHSVTPVVTPQSVIIDVTTYSVSPVVTTHSVTPANSQWSGTNDDGPLATPHSVDPDATQHTVATVVAPYSLAPVVTPLSVTPAVTPNSVAPVVTPHSVTHVVTPNSVAPVFTPHSVTHVVTPNSVAPAVTPNSVIHVVTPNSIAPVVTPLSVTHVVTPNSVAPAVTPNSVTHVVTPNSIAPVVTPQSVAPVVTANSLAAMDTPYSVAPVVTPHDFAPIVTSQSVAPAISLSTPVFTPHLIPDCSVVSHPAVILPVFSCSTSLSVIQDCPPTISNTDSPIPLTCSTPSSVPRSSLIVPPNVTDTTRHVPTPVNVMSLLPNATSPTNVAPCTFVTQTAISCTSISYYTTTHPVGPTGLQSHILPPAYATLVQTVSHCNIPCQVLQNTVSAKITPFSSPVPKLKSCTSQPILVKTYTSNLPIMQQCVTPTKTAPLYSSTFRAAPPYTPPFQTQVKRGLRLPPPPPPPPPYTPRKNTNQPATQISVLRTDKTTEKDKDGSKDIQEDAKCKESPKMSGRASTLKHRAQTPPVALMKGRGSPAKACFKSSCLSSAHAQLGVLHKMLCSGARPRPNTPCQFPLPQSQQGCSRVRRCSVPAERPTAGPLTPAQADTLRQVQEILGGLMSGAKCKLDPSIVTEKLLSPNGPLRDIRSLQTQLQSLEGVLETSQNTIKILLDVIQDLEKKEAVRDGHLYRTGQDIENCGTCRDCACIIYSVEHDFRLQEGQVVRKWKVGDPPEDRPQTPTPPPSTPLQQDSPQAVRPPISAKKNRKKCFWFL
ncbi:uncharacterized protein [Eucyclogobius newberryi]|uniref:uncharacterized protein isoform X2 n=1 Tax=Eucyclogobius newberryi TaxID=166745 RepID=UPI003B58D60B